MLKSNTYYSLYYAVQNLRSRPELNPHDVSGFVDKILEHGVRPGTMMYLNPRSYKSDFKSILDVLSGDEFIKDVDGDIHILNDW
jgi:hypothetical protein